MTKNPRILKVQRKHEEKNFLSEKSEKGRNI